MSQHSLSDAFASWEEFWLGQIESIEDEGGNQIDK